MRIVAFGCSYTYGQGLHDCFEIKTNKPGDLPSKFSWPSMLSNKMNINCANMSEPGSGNKEILHKLLNFDLKNDDIVIIMWTFSERWCTLNEYGIDRLRLNCVENINAYDVVFNEYDLNVDLIYRANFAKFYLDSRHVKNYHLSVNKTYSKLIDKLTWNNVDFLSIDVDYIKNTTQPALDIIYGTPHPGVDAHVQIANLLYDEISNAHNK